MSINTSNLTSDEIFDRQVHRIGRATILTCILLALSIPLMAVVVFGIMPPTGPLISGIITVSSFMIPLSIAEILSFYPILEGDIISTIAMAGSVIVCELILIAGVLLLVPLSGYLQNPILKPAFDQILPALFGSLGAYFILKNYRLAVIPLIFGILFAMGNLNTAIAVPLCVFISIFGAEILYKKGLVKA